MVASKKLIEILERKIQPKLAEIWVSLFLAKTFGLWYSMGKNE